MPDLRPQYANIEHEIDNFKYKAQKCRTDAKTLICRAEIYESCADALAMALDEEKKKKILYRCAECGDLIAIDINNFHCKDCRE